MNEPLVHGRFTLYQSSFQAPAHGREVSVLTAACDPGRGLKYSGSVMICVGICIMFTLRSYTSWKQGSDVQNSILPGNPLAICDVHARQN